MSGGSLYASYIATLAERFSSDIRQITRHQERIDRFGVAIAPFGLLPSICPLSDGVVSLMAVCSQGKEPPIRALIDAGYTVDGPCKKEKYSNQQPWVASCSGHGVEFELHFTTAI